MVLAFATGNAGGITRDLLIGAVPPAAIRDWRYLGVCILAGFVTFCGIPISMCSAGPCSCSMARDWLCSPSPGRKKRWPRDSIHVMAAIMGMLTGIGGGMLRDVLVNETPTVLRADLYAVAALAAGVVVVTGHVLHYPSSAFMIAGAVLCFWLRVMAIFRGWHLPIAGTRPRSH